MLCYSSGHQGPKETIKGEESAQKCGKQVGYKCA